MHLLSVLGDILAEKAGICEAWQAPLTLLLLLGGVLITKFPLGLFARFENLLGKIADQPYLSAALIAGFAACARLALSPFLGTPQPIVPDEIGLLFQAKTYLGGHLATHVSLLPDFESVYVLLSPTYASMYPVLRSFPIFIGYCLGPGAWAGVLLSMVALAVAVYWMVREWINARYGLIAALIVILFTLGRSVYRACRGAVVGGFKAVRSRPNLIKGAVVGLGVVIFIPAKLASGRCILASTGGLRNGETSRRRSG
jgi:hypothetical protein